jgi:uncharacterized protein (DUF1800 family)
MPAVGERAAVRRLFDRFGFGARPGELNAATAKGFDRTAAAILSTVDDPGAKATPPPVLDGEPDRSKQQDVEARRKAQDQLRDQQTAITIWWLDRMVASDAPLLERITWFWHGHFATSAQKVRSARLMLQQNQTLRQHALGDFSVLAKAMVVDPALLVWLDGQKNTAKAANENLARELMELFTLGVNQYTEQDVRESARALTGWKVNRDAMTATFTPKQHDAKDKTVLGHTGKLDAQSLVDILVAAPPSPRFIAQRLWYRLVSTNPPGEDSVVRLVSAYGPGRDVSAMLKAIIAEPAFKAEASTMVKQPVEWAVGLMRAFGIRPAQLPDPDQKKLLAGLRGMGQVPFLPPSVGGWPGGGAWLTTASGLARLQLARLLTAHADPKSLTGDDSVDAAANLLGVDSWSDRTKKALSTVADQPAQLAAVAATAPEFVVSG